MATTARVELKGSLTHTSRGRSFKKGQPQIITNPSEIQYYQQQAGFSVTMMEPEPKKAAPKAAPPPPPEPPEVEDDEEEEPELPELPAAPKKKTAKKRGGK